MSWYSTILLVLAEPTTAFVLVRPARARAHLQFQQDVPLQSGNSESIYFESRTITHAYAIISPVILSSPSFDALHLPETLVFPFFVIDVGPVKMFFATYTGVRMCQHEFYGSFHVLEQ